MKYYLLPILSCVLVLSSCKKEDIKEIVDQVPQQVPIFNLSSTPGNYWIYDWYKIDSLGNETILAIQDSVYVVGDTVINGKNYVHYGGTYMGSLNEFFQRDSTNYIVSSKGDIVFSTSNFTDTTRYFEDLVANTKFYGMTKDYVGTLTTPKGIFDVFNYQEHYYSTDGTPFTPCDSSWVKHTYYDQFKGFEVIGYTAFYAQLFLDCTRYKRVLVRGYF